MLARLTGTMILGVVAMMTLGFVDTWFISLLGTNQLAAIGFIIPVYMIFISIALGIKGAAAGNVIAGIIAYRVIKESLYRREQLVAGNYIIRKLKQRGNEYESIIWR